MSLNWSYCTVFITDAVYLMQSWCSFLQVSGLGITAVGVLAFLVSYRYVSLIGGHFDPLIICTYLLLGTGAVIILLAFTMGCCATCRRSRPCLMMVSWSLLCLSIPLIAECYGLLLLMLALWPVSVLLILFPYYHVCLVSQKREIFVYFNSKLTQTQNEL